MITFAKKLLLIAVINFVFSAGAMACEDGHWIDSVMANGKIIKLEDGSVWRIDDFDTIDSALWLPVSDIIACDDKLINTDDNESVDATQIH